MSRRQCKSSLDVPAPDSRFRKICPHGRGSSRRARPASDPLPREGHGPGPGAPVPSSCHRPTGGRKSLGRARGHDAGEKSPVGLIDAGTLNKARQAHSPLPGSATGEGGLWRGNGRGMKEKALAPGDQTSALRFPLFRGRTFSHRPPRRCPIRISPPSSGPSPTCSAATTGNPNTARSSCPSPMLTNQGCFLGVQWVGLFHCRRIPKVSDESMFPHRNTTARFPSNAPRRIPFPPIGGGENHSSTQWTKSTRPTLVGNHHFEDLGCPIDGKPKPKIIYFGRIAIANGVGRCC